jgi:hypothetical protein
MRSPIETTVSATGTTAAPINLNVSNVVAAEATKERLRELDALLRRRIAALTDEDLKNGLLTRLDADRDLISTAGVDRLNDARDKDLLDPNGEKNKGLNDRQNKTKQMFTARLQGNAAAEDINRLFGEMSEVRAGLFQKYLQDFERKSTEKGYDKFNDYMRRTPPDRVTARIPGQARPEINLRNELGAQTTVRSQRDPNTEVHFGANGYTATSKDPVALGLGMVADGQKSITFGGHPRRALAAAQAALDAGAEDVDLEENSKNAMYVSSGLFDSFDEAKALRDQYDRLRERVAAMKFARLNSATSVFGENVTEARQHAETFGKIGTPDGHLDYLRTLNSDQRARLALELRDLNAPRPEAEQPVYRLGEVNLDEYNYISGLLGTIDGPRWTQGQAAEFRDAYARIQTTPQQIDTFKSYTHPHEAAYFISNIKSPEARARFYAEIDNMTGDGNPEFKNKVRAACLSALVERRYKLASNDPKSTREDYKLTAAKADPAEVNEILRGKSPEEIAYIKQYYEQHYDRLFIKLAQFTPEYNARGIPEGRSELRNITFNAPTGELRLPTDGLQSFYAKEERNPVDGNPRSRLLTTPENVSRYLSFDKIVSERVEHLRTHHQDVLPAKRAGIDRVEISPAPLAPGAGPGARS